MPVNTIIFFVMLIMGAIFLGARNLSKGALLGMLGITAALMLFVCASAAEKSNDFGPTIGIVGFFGAIAVGWAINRRRG